jgi:hypothetical protein
MLFAASENNIKYGIFVARKFSFVATRICACYRVSRAKAEAAKSRKPYLSLLGGGAERTSVVRVTQITYF